MYFVTAEDWTLLLQVSYLHIKTYLTLQEMGVSEEIESPSESNKPGKAFYTIIYIPSWHLINYSFLPDIGGDPNLSFKQTRRSEFHGDDLPAAKCRKIETDVPSHLEATETSILEWIRGRNEVCFMIYWKCHFLGPIFWNIILFSRLLSPTLSSTSMEVIENQCLIC